MITNEKLKFLTVQSLQSLEMDVLFLEKYVKNMDITSSDTFNCSDSFTELRQLVGFCKNQAGYEDILNPTIKQRKFGRMEIPDVLAVLEKYNID